LKVQYYLKNQMDSVTIEILDNKDQVIHAFIGKEIEYKPDPNLPWWRRGGSTEPTVATGLNSFTWDLRYPGATVFEGMIIWSARPQRGPKAPIGDYKVRLSVGDQSSVHTFSLLMNPNLEGITEEDLIEQFNLCKKIIEKESAANEAVIEIREMKSTIETGLKSVADSELTGSANELLDEITLIEEALYQTKNQSAQDPLNYPIRLNNKLSSLRRSIENGDARPTDAAYQVFDELSVELADHLEKLDDIKKGDWASLKKKL
jgi:hypothetical protein